MSIATDDVQYGGALSQGGAVAMHPGKLFVRNGKWKGKAVTHTHGYRGKGFAWAEVQLLIATMGEALALPFFKVGFAERKCSARFTEN